MRVLGELRHITLGQAVLPPHSAFFSPTQNAAPKGAAFDPVAKQKLDQLDAPD